MFFKDKLAIEVDEERHKDRDDQEETEKQKAIERGPYGKFIRINSEEKDFDMDIEIGKICNQINRSSKKSLLDMISKRLLELEFKSNQNSIKSRCLRFVIKNILQSL